MNPSYIAKNLDELYDAAPDYIVDLIHGKDVNETTAILGKLYKIPVSLYLALSNLISFILIGALAPENVVRAFQDILKLSPEDANKLAADLDKTILEKARIRVLGKSPKDLVTLTFQEGRSPDELRKEILDTTKREQVLPNSPTAATPETTTAAVIPPVSAPVTKPTPQSEKKNIVAGSRSQLLEQLQILDTIPNDEEIGDRLQKIQEQISGMKEKDDRALDSNIALQEFMPKTSETIVVEPESKAASYSKAPTKYNVDPYREAATE